jgi:hypothetical protein
MRYKIFVITLILVFTTSIYATIEVQGTIHFNSDSSKDVTFIVSNRIYPSEFDMKIISAKPGIMKIQEGINYIDENGKKQTLSPDNAESIEFVYEGDTIKMERRNQKVQKGFKVIDKYFFIEVVAEGKAKLLCKYDVFDGKNDRFNGNHGFGSGFPHVCIHFIIEQNNVEFYLPFTSDWTKTNYKNVLLAIFNDCPEVVNNIKSKLLVRDEVLKMVNDYNSKCDQNKSNGTDSLKNDIEPTSEEPKVETETSK